MSGIVSGIPRSEHPRLWGATTARSGTQGCQPTGPRRIPRQSCARRPTLSGLCSVVSGLRPNGAENRRDARDLLRAFYPAMKLADVKRFRFHDLRHTFATRLVQAGADIYSVQKLGRWKTISMVLRYAHRHSESLRAGIEILDRVPAEISTKLAQSAN